MGLMMIMFRTAYFPTQDADLDKQFEVAPLAYQEEYEVEYDPSAALAAKDSAEDYGLEGQPDGSAGALATGVAVGAAAGAAAAGASISSLSMNDDTLGSFNQQASGSQQADGHQQETETGFNTFDDSSWLDQPGEPEPVGSQY